MKLFSVDDHIIEPPDLWPRYIDPAFRDRAPVGLTEDAGDLRLAFEGKPWGRVAVTVARVAGIALIALGVACWPGPPRVGMLTYSATVTLYLAYVGFAGGLTGILLWPAVVLHVILTALLTRESTSDKETKT